MHVKNQKDLVCGVLFMLLGVAFAWAASGYRMGSAQDMGPGYVPLLLGALLTLLGGLLSFKALVFETEDGGRMGRWAWRPLLLGVLANLAFALLLGGLPALGLPPLGLVAALLALALLAVQTQVLRWKERLVLVLVLALGGYLLLVLGLKLPLPLWPSGAAAGV